MANYHVLTGSPDGNSFRIVFHVPVPGAGNNRANVQWRTALANSGLGGTTVLRSGDGTGGTISAAELASIQSGALFEVVEDVPTHPGESAAQYQARVDALYTAVVARAQAALQGRLTYFGHTRNVP